MQVAIGATRIVLLAGARAYKLPRPRPLTCLKRLIRGMLFPSSFLNRLAKHNLLCMPLPEAAWTYIRAPLINGILANRQEGRLYQSHPQLPIARVICVFGGGLLLVMERGASVHPELSEDFRRRHPGADLGRPRQVASFPEGLRFIDYGHPNIHLAFGLRA